MTPEQDPPSRTVKDAAIEASGTLARSIGSQPVMIGFLIVTLFVLYVAWQVGVEVRKVEHLQARLLLERCLPVPRGGS